MIARAHVPATLAWHLQRHLTPTARSGSKLLVASSATDPRPVLAAAAHPNPFGKPRTGRASTPPLICSTGIPRQGCGACVTPCSPVRKDRTGDSSSNPGNPCTTSSTWVARCGA
jgi:hypothetical protein